MSEYVTTAVSILRALNDNGFEAYFVGGYVRDSLLNIPTKDIDITTSALPEEVMQIFENVKETGKRFGTVTVIVNNLAYEVTTFRAEGTYSDRRRPDTISFSNSIEEDVVRRDFTVNGICMNADGKVIDLVEGESDLKTKTLRMIGNPSVRLEEDILRALRAVRFVSSHGFKVEAETKHALKESAKYITTLPIERIMQELNKVFKGKYLKEALELLIDTGLAHYLYGLEKGLKYLLSLKEITDLSVLDIFTVCFIKDHFDDVWRFSNQHQRLIIKLMNLHEITRSDDFNTFMVFSHGLELCKLVNHINVILGYKDQTNNLIKIDKAMPVKDVCDLAFKGQDIMQLTELRKHSLIGLVIDDLLERVLDGRLENEYEVLKAYALKKINKLQLGESNE